MKTHTINIPVQDLKKWGEDSQNRETITGKYHLYIGANANNKKLSYSFEINR